MPKHMHIDNQNEQQQQKKVTYKTLLTTGLYIKIISSFQLIVLYISNVTISNIFLIVLACKNITCKLEKRSEEIQLCTFKICLEFLKNSSEIIKTEHMRKNYLDFTVKWLLDNRFIHFSEVESDSFLVLSFQYNCGRKSWWEHLSFEKRTVKIDTKVFSEPIYSSEYLNLALFESKQSKQSLQSLLTLSVHLKYVYSNYLLRVGLFCIMLDKRKYSSWD